MSWSITFNDIPNAEIPHDILEQMITQHIKYGEDMRLALYIAKRAGLKSGTLTGMRTPSPYGDDEVIDISIRGFVNAVNFNEEMKRILRAGPQ